MSAFKIDRMWDYAPAPWIVGYVVRITNGTQAMLPMVHLRAARRMRPEILHRVPNLAPGATVALPVGTVHDLGFYDVAAYDAQGHMIARIPTDLGAISPAEAASTLPLRANDHTDEWVITEAHLLSANDPYVISIVNQTPDTWDEVTVIPVMPLA